MTDSLTVKKIIHKCDQCGEKQHVWNEVYYGDRATLKKVEKTYIAWCEKSKNYVLLNKKLC
ncbi:MAG: hypothetical protein H6587_02540 [Flavobacteriales bacterium]|nr:hypothetical protein [Flavobacteriales bacterium]MCB9363424.1 hypothetical protein [Flavobacteriales bacterium]